MKSTKTQNSKALLCACESGKTYAACCKIYYDGERAPDAEALVRSRYTAYTLNLEAYLLKTWHPQTRPASLDLNLLPSNVNNFTAMPSRVNNLTVIYRHIFWFGLQIKQSKTISKNEATVEFVVRYKDNSNMVESSVCNKLVNFYG